MSKILEINKKLQSFNFNSEIRNVIFNNSEFIVDLNRDQLRTGHDANGLMRNYRSLSYALRKQSSGIYFAPFPVIDLYDTGSFQNGMNFSISGDNWEINSTDSKTAELKFREGDEILELSESSLEMARSVNNEDIVNRIRKII